RTRIRADVVGQGDARKHEASRHRHEDGRDQEGDLAGGQTTSMDTEAGGSVKSARAHGPYGFFRRSVLAAGRAVAAGRPTFADALGEAGGGAASTFRWTSRAPSSSVPVATAPPRRSAVTPSAPDQGATSRRARVPSSSTTFTPVQRTLSIGRSAVTDTTTR